MIRFFLFVFLTSIVNPSFSQRMSEEIYKQLLENWWKSKSMKAREVRGLLEIRETINLKLDSTQSTIVSFQPPSVLYKKLEGKLIERKISIPANWQDTVMHAEEIVQLDTLTLASLKKLRRKSTNELKGDNPTIWGNWLGPLTGVLFSVGSIVALFFLRSSPN